MRIIYQRFRIFRGFTFSLPLDHSHTLIHGLKLRGPVYHYCINFDSKPDIKCACNIIRCILAPPCLHVSTFLNWKGLYKYEFFFFLKAMLTYCEIIFLQWSSGVSTSLPSPRFDYRSMQSLEFFWFVNLSLCFYIITYCTSALERTPIAYWEAQVSSGIIQFPPTTWK